MYSWFMLRELTWNSIERLMLQQCSLSLMRCCKRWPVWPWLGLEDCWSVRSHCENCFPLLATVLSPGQHPAPRALHSLTRLGTCCLLVGGSGPGGSLGDVALLQSPPLEAGLRLQRELGLTRQQLLEAQKQMASWEAEVVVSTEEAWRSKKQLQVRC